MVSMIPIVAIMSTFTFVSFVIWLATQQKEREAFYKAESLRRITESSGDGAKAALELIREEDRWERIKKYEGIKLGGLISIAVGVAMVIFLKVLAGSDPGVPYLVGLIPGLIGVAMLVYVYLLAGPVPKD